MTRCTCGRRATSYLGVGLLVEEALGCCGEAKRHTLSWERAHGANLLTPYSLGTHRVSISAHRWRSLKKKRKEIPPPDLLPHMKVAHRHAHERSWRHMTRDQQEVICHIIPNSAAGALCTQNEITAAALVGIGNMLPIGHRITARFWTHKGVFCLGVVTTG